MRAAKILGGGDHTNGQSRIDSRGSTVIFAGEDVVSTVVKRFPMQHSAAQRPAGLGTDSDIGGRTGGAGGSGGHRSAERRLQKVGGGDARAMCCVLQRCYYLERFVMQVCF